MLSQSDPLNRVTSWVADDLDRVLQVLLPDPDGAGMGVPAPVYETVCGDPPPETHTAYDILSRIISEEDALGNLTQFVWNDSSRLDQRIDTESA